MDQTTLWEKYQLLSVQGRHFLWEHSYFPWWKEAFAFANKATLIEWAFEARNDGRCIPYIRYLCPVDRYEFLPEVEFWELVFKTAESTGSSLFDTLRAFISTPFDMESEPPHPFCRVSLLSGNPA